MNFRLSKEVSIFKPDAISSSIGVLNDFVEPANQWISFESDGTSPLAGLVIGNDRDDTNTHIRSGRIELNAGGQTCLTASTGGLATNKIVMGSSLSQFAWVYENSTGNLLFKKVM